MTRSDLIEAMARAVFCSRWPGHAWHEKPHDDPPSNEVVRTYACATVPINESARIALEAAMAIRTCDSVIEFGGKPVKKIRKAFERVAVAAELPWVTPHVLRHTSAVWMAENGVALQEIGQYLGHTDYQTTYRVYARFTPGYLKKAAGALEVL